MNIDFTVGYFVGAAALLMAMGLARAIARLFKGGFNV